MKRTKYVWLTIILISGLLLTACVQVEVTTSPTPPTSLPAPTAQPTRPPTNYPQAILGKDNWLFAGEPINELIRAGGLDDHQIVVVVKGLNRINNSLKKQGVDFLFLFVPAKHLIYPEFMPDTYNEGDLPSSYERLSKALSKTDIDFIDCKSLLEKKKETGYRLYYMRDQNWNPLGNFYVIQEILTHLGKKHPVPKFELLSVDTSETRICDTQRGNDLNDFLGSLPPWQEKGVPQPVYNVYPESQAPPILWYGSCMSPEVIDMLKEGWPNSITYIPLFFLRENFGFPQVLYEDISRRLADHKVVIFEIPEHSRSELSSMLVPRTTRGR